VRVFSALKDKIESGELGAGEQMPSLRQISEDYGVSQSTAKKAIQQLADEGLVEIKPRWGTFVR
jgi:GntR family transcriptional regulator